MTPSYSEHPAMFRNHPFGFVLAILLIPAAVGILILLWWYLKCRSTKLSFIGRDLVLERGLLSKNRTELSAVSVRTVNVYQSLVDRMMGVGRLSIYTAGDVPEIEVTGIPRPHDVRDLIKQQQTDA
ncbi:MAG: PH domain-containing protein [Abyssibacter sp.]|uniref:PH domain-containing protein n=1 Tax=Abyssibacter sp. TaxID=2320200 RepID=UPI002E9DA41E|nr:PH domain-containing protein [Pseudomonadota bacterium]